MSHVALLWQQDGDSGRDSSQHVGLCSAVAVLTGSQ